MPRWWVVALALLLALTACSAGDGRPRTRWSADHRVVESGALTVTGRTLSAEYETTGVSLGRDAGGGEISCSVNLYRVRTAAPGAGGGERSRTVVNGHPGWRSGAGAEYPYLQWQQDGGAWTEVSCSPGYEQLLDVVARAVRFRRTPVELPFGVDALPRDYEISVVQTSNQEGTYEVFLGRLVPELSTYDSETLISYGRDGLPQRPTGRAITVAGRPAVLDENPNAPAVCIVEQGRPVCVSAYTFDTVVDRSAEIPVLLEIAGKLRLAPDLGDRSTWFEAHRVLPR